MRSAITFCFSMIFVFSSSLAGSGCGEQDSDPPKIGMTKQRAQASEDWSVDYCAMFDWYGDGICDDFCPEPDPDCEIIPPTDHRPYCGAIGSRSEGWYWGDSGTLIAYARCAGLADPICDAIGSRSEGWYSTDGRIVWDR